MGEPEDQIRRAASTWIQSRWPTARVLYEVGLEHGLVRADIVTLTRDELHGFELRSHADKIRRLPEQVRVYGETMDRATLVVSERLYMAALSIVPAWWGLCLFRATRQLEVVREAAANPSPVGLTTARLLWKDEALALLREVGKGVVEGGAVEAVPGAAEGAACGRAPRAHPAPSPGAPGLEAARVTDGAPCVL